MKIKNKELYTKIISKNAHISIIGLGYVGLPLLLALGKEGFKMTGIDIDNKKISDLKKNKSKACGIDWENSKKNREPVLLEKAINESMV